MTHPELIVMLTKDDRTVENASQVFALCKDAKARFFGFKEHPLPPEEMKALCAAMRTQGKTTILEVVAYTEGECLAGARLAADCGCDILMGTRFFDSVNAVCQANGLKYMPFVGIVSQRPSILEGTAEEMIREARAYLEKGVYGIDLLGYRHTGDALALIREFVTQIDAPVCVAGSVNSYERLDELKEIGPWAFTIGGAFFEGKFGEGFREQIDRVCDYMQK